MNNEIFWQIIDESRAECGNPDDPNEQAKKLTKILMRFEASELLEFIKIFYECRWRAYRWDLWAVAFIAYEGCSDDSFDEFRVWLISRGKDFFEKAIADYMTAAVVVKQFLPEESAISTVWLLLAPGEVYQQKIGHTALKDLPASAYTYAGREPVGKAWSQSLVCSDFSEVCALFGRTSSDRDDCRPF